MLWELEIHPAPGQIDREARRIEDHAAAMGIGPLDGVRTARLFLIETEAASEQVERISRDLLTDPVVETAQFRSLPTTEGDADSMTVLLKAGVTDNTGRSARNALARMGLDASAVATGLRVWINGDLDPENEERLRKRVLANDAIEQILIGPLTLESLALGKPYRFTLQHTPIREMSDGELERLSIEGQLYLSLVEMQTIQQHFRNLDRDPTDCELETIAQTWSEHCSHKTLAGRIHYRDDQTDRQFENMLKETIFQATVTIREQLGNDDWCVSVFKDNAGIVTFDDDQHVCFKVETHNHPSAIEPYGGANTGIGGVIRDPLGTGLGAKPICNTDVFCFAPPDVPVDELPPGVLHPRAVAEGVVAGVRDYGNRMGIPTVNGAVYFDKRYLGNPLVYCGNVAMIPVDRVEKNVRPGDLIVAAGGRTGRDGIHGATFSSAELTEESETLSGGAVQIGNPITEKMMADVILEARDRGLYSAITDCGAGGFSSAVGEMGEETGAEVDLEKCPLKYEGLSYTEIWISEAQERMVMSVPERHWDELRDLFASEGVEVCVIGTFTDTGRLVLKYEGETVGDLAMSFLHDGRPPVIREATYAPSDERPLGDRAAKMSFEDDLLAILGSLNVASKEWIIRQYDHEVQAGSVVKPLVGVQEDGPSDAAVVRPTLNSPRGLAIACGMNPHFGDADPYWMAASAIDEAVRNCVAVGADPKRIAILDNFCWGNTERPETLGSLVRAALACHDIAIAFGTPFISGKDSLNNDFSYRTESGETETVSIPSSLLISALGQLDDVKTAVTMDLKSAGNRLFQIGRTHDEMGGSHYAFVNGFSGGTVPRVDAEAAPKVFAAVHDAISRGTVRSCHDLSEGGLAIALAEMAFAGGFGLDVAIDPVAEDNDLIHKQVLFSESNTRFVVEVAPDRVDEFLSALEGVPVYELGTVTEETRLIVRYRDRTIVDADIEDLRHAFKEPLAWA